MTRHLPQAERRRQILGAARTVFVEKGYLSARIQDVADRAMIAKGTVYFYFSSKREVLDALIDEEHRVALGFLEEADRDPRPAVEKLVDLGTKYLRFYSTLPSPPRFFLLMNGLAIRDEEIRERVLTVHERFLGLLSALIEQGIQEGQFREIDPLAGAMLLKATMDGLVGQAAIGVPPDTDRLLTDGIRVVLAGLVRPEGATT